MGRQSKVLSKQEIHTARNYLDKVKTEKKLRSDKELEDYVRLTFEKCFKSIITEDSYNYSADQLNSKLRDPIVSLFHTPKDKLYEIYESELDFYEGFLVHNKKIPGFIKALIAKQCFENLNNHKWNTSSVRGISDTKKKDEYEFRLACISESIASNHLFEQANIHNNKENYLPIRLTDHIYKNPFYCNFLLELLIPYTKPTKRDYYLECVKAGFSKSSISKLITPSLVSDYIILFDHFNLVNDIKKTNEQNSKSMPIYNEKIFQVITSHFNINKEQVRHYLRAFFDKDYHTIF